MTHNELAMLKKNHTRRGASAVEFAMVLPVLVLLIFGGIELTRVSMLQHTVDHAAYIAARDAIVPGANVSDVIQTAENHLQTIGVQGATITVTPSEITDSTTEVLVRVVAPVSGNSLVVPNFASSDVIGQARLLTERSPGQMSNSLPEPPPPPPDDDDGGGAGSGGNDDGDDDNDPPPPPSDPPPPPPPPPAL